MEREYTGVTNMNSYGVGNGGHHSSAPEIVYTNFTTFTNVISFYKYYKKKNRKVVSETKCRISVALLRYLHLYSGCSGMYYSIISLSATKRATVS